MYSSLNKDIESRAVIYINKLIEIHDNTENPSEELEAAHNMSVHYAAIISDLKNDDVFVPPSDLMELSDAISEFVEILQELIE